MFFSRFKYNSLKWNFVELGQNWFIRKWFSSIYHYCYYRMFWYQFRLFLELIYYRSTFEIREFLYTMAPSFLLPELNNHSSCKPYEFDEMSVPTSSWFWSPEPIQKETQICVVWRLFCIRFSLVKLRISVTMKRIRGMGWGPSIDSDLNPWSVDFGNRSIHQDLCRVEMMADPVFPGWTWYSNVCQFRVESLVESLGYSIVDLDLLFMTSFNFRIVRIVPQTERYKLNKMASHFDWLRPWTVCSRNLEA